MGDIIVYLGEEENEYLVDIDAETVNLYPLQEKGDLIEKELRKSGISKFKSLLSCLKW